MPTSHRLSGAAVVGCLITIFITNIVWAGDRPIENDAIYYSGHQSPADDVRAAAPEDDTGFWGKHDGNSKTYEAICQKPQTSGYAELCQQWRSAEASVRQAQYVGPTFIISMISIFGICISVFLSIISIRQSGISINIMKSQTKPIIDIKEAKLEFVREDGGGYFRFDVRVKNVGQTTAIGVSLRATPATDRVISGNVGKFSNIGNVPPEKELVHVIETVMRKEDVADLTREIGNNTPRHKLMLIVEYIFCDCFSGRHDFSGDNALVFQFLESKIDKDKFFAAII